jgi:hypothetical protein
MSRFDVRITQEEYLYKCHYDDFGEILDKIKKLPSSKKTSVILHLENWTSEDLHVLDSYLTRCGFFVSINYDQGGTNSVLISIIVL